MSMQSPTGTTQHRELVDYVAQDATFPTAYLRAVAAIASSDGVLNVADFNALNDVASLLNDSALARVVLLEYIERPIPWREALVDLQTAAANIDHATAAAAFEAARTLLSLQGNRSRELAKSLADALRYNVRPDELAVFPADEQTMWNKVSMGSVRIVKGRKYADLADLCLRATGDAELANAVLAFEHGSIDKTELARRMTNACAVASAEIATFNARIADIEGTRDTALVFLESAHALQKQVAQRLAIADARIAFERDTFAEDIEEILHDGGNAFERDVVERLGTDKWKRAIVWESIAKSTFGKELERRVNRVIARREESLRLIHEDLRLFQEDMSLSRSTILKRLHHSQLSSNAPTLRWGTRLKNGVETAANTTLAAGGATVLGTGAAAYFLGAAVVMPVIAPAAPIIGGVLLVAGAFKWMMNPGERKIEEISHQRAIFEQAFRAQLDAARGELNTQLDATAQQFHATAQQLVRPVLLEAQAAERLSDLHLRVARKLNDHSQKALAEMMAALPE